MESPIKLETLMREDLLLQQQRDDEREIADIFPDDREVRDELRHLDNIRKLLWDHLRMEDEDGEKELFDTET